MESSPLSDVSFENIFSESVACLLIVLILSFIELKFLVLVTSGFSVLSFTDQAFGVVSQKSSPYMRSYRFSPDAWRFSLASPSSPVGIFE